VIWQPVDGRCWSWPLSGPSLIPSLFVCEAWELVSLFYSGDSLRPWPSWDSVNRWREQDAWGAHTWRQRKCIAGFCFFVFFCFFFLITVYSLPLVLVWHPGLAISPWNRLLFGFLVIFSECNLLCSFEFQFTHFILFYFILFAFFIHFILLLLVECNL